MKLHGSLLEWKRLNSKPRCSFEKPGLDTIFHHRWWICVSRAVGMNFIYSIYGVRKSSVRALCKTNEWRGKGNQKIKKWIRNTKRWWRTVGAVHASPTFFQSIKLQQYRRTVSRVVRKPSANAWRMNHTDAYTQTNSLHGWTLYLPNRFLYRPLWHDRLNHLLTKLSVTCCAAVLTPIRDYGMCIGTSIASRIYGIYVFEYVNSTSKNCIQ